MPLKTYIETGKKDESSVLRRFRSKPGQQIAAAILRRPAPAANHQPAPIFFKGDGVGLAPAYSQLGHTSTSILEPAAEPRSPYTAPCKYWQSR